MRPMNLSWNLIIVLFSQEEIKHISKKSHSGSCGSKYKNQNIFRKSSKEGWNKWNNAATELTETDYLQTVYDLWAVSIIPMKIMVPITL